MIGIGYCLSKTAVRSKYRRLAEQRWQHSCPERTNNKGCRPNEIEGKEVGDLLFCTYWFSLVSRFRSTVARVSGRHKLEPAAAGLEPKWRPCTCNRLHVRPGSLLYCALYSMCTCNLFPVRASTVSRCHMYTKMKEWILDANLLFQV